MRKQLFNFKIMVLVGFTIAILLGALAFAGTDTSAQSIPPNFENNTNIKNPEPAEKIDPALQTSRPLNLAPAGNYPADLPPAEGKTLQPVPKGATELVPGAQVQPQAPQTQSSPRSLSPQMPADDVYLWPPAADTDIWQSNPNSNFGADTEMWVGDLDRDRLLVRWDLSPLPAKAMIQDAWASLNLLNYTGTTNPDIATHGVASAWTESGATWNNSQSGTAWTNPGGDYFSTVEDITNVTTTVDTWFSWYVADLVAEWHSGYTTNNGLLFKATDPGLSSIRKIRTKEYNSAVPELDIKYLPGPIALSSYSPFSWWVPSPDWFTRPQQQAYWEVVATRPNPNADYDLHLYSDANYSTLVKESLQGTGAYDLVLIDGNHAAATNYYPKTTQYDGRGSYQVETANHTADLQTGTYGPYTVTPNQVVRVWDQWMVAGTDYYFSVRPSSGDADLALRIYQSNNGSTANTCPGSFCSRAEYLAYADNYTSGTEFMGPVQITGANDWLGLLVVNTGSSVNTDYKVYVDTTTPSAGSVSINGGAATTTSQNVTLTLSATDAETGIGFMRIANSQSGLDSATWETYVSSKSWTLTSGFGTKTVYVQYANNAGIYNPNNIYTDSIDYISGGGGTSKSTVPFAWKVSGAIKGPCQSGNNWCEENDTRTTAYGPISYIYTYQAYPDDTEDFYFIYKQTTSTINIQVTNYLATGQLVLYDANGGLIQNYGAGGSTMTINVSNLPAGTYYIRVYTSAGWNSNNLYNLKVTF